MPKSINEVVSLLPIELLVPLVIIVLLIPLIKIILETIRDSRSHRRESLAQIVAYLEKYREKKDSINAYAVEEAFRHKYQAPVKISEINLFPR